MHSKALINLKPGDYGFATKSLHPGAVKILSLAQPPFQNPFSRDEVGKFEGLATVLRFDEKKQSIFTSKRNINPVSAFRAGDLSRSESAAI